MEAVKLPEGITLKTLQDNWNTARREYESSYRRLKVLDLADRGKIWETISKNFPEYQITPDTNYTNYVKENILASVYTVGKSASLMARKPEDRDLVDGLNMGLETLWGVLNVPYYQLQAGERAALTNLGITQVGWNSDIIDGTTDNVYKGDVIFKNIDPLCYMRDPFADDLDDAGYCIYHDIYHKMSLMQNPRYASRLKDYKPDPMQDIIRYNREAGRNPGADDNYMQLIIHWVKAYDEKQKEVVIHEVHTIANGYVLYVRENIQPCMFPFAELYSNLPAKDPIGISEPAKILSSSIVLNLLDGIMVTHAYKAQRPPRLISDRSGLNVRMFRQYGNDPDKAFLVHGSTDGAVDYITFPPLPQGLDNVAMRLSAAIERMSGIDSKYTGKDTGSILTTGGIDSMLAQATMRDATRIRLYEAYTAQLTKLVIYHLIEYGDKRKYTFKPKNSLDYRTVELNLPDIPSDILFNFSVDISTDIPKNKAKLSASADAILEKSMQYQSNPPILTIEEWLMYQDFPQKDLILARLKLDREANMTEQVTQVLSMFAGLMEQGMDPTQALNTVVQQMQSSQDPAAAGGTQIPPPAGPPGGQGPMM
jgi:hypothetical protein